MWERYAYQSENQSKRRKFFAEIDQIAKKYIADTVFHQAHAALHRSKRESPTFIWDESLLPASTAPHVLRLWISDSSRTRKFLTALFRHYADVYRKGSIVRRTVTAVNTADKYGWKPLKTTEALVESGDIN